MFAETLSGHCEDLLFGQGVDLRNRRTLVSNMIRLYHIIRASAPLIEVAIQHCEDGSEIRKYFETHLEEERNHDEWLLTDLKNARVNPFPCPPSSAAFAGAIYYHIRHTSPVALLGYMLVLEGNPNPLETIAELEQLHGPELLRTSRYHAENDWNHRKDLLKLINGLTSLEQMIVKQVALETVDRLIGIMNEIRGE